MSRPPATSIRLADVVTTALVCVILAVVTWLVFWRTTQYDFVPYDDNQYVYNNPEVTRGLSLKTATWAFTHLDLRLWTPLTTISHMADCQFFGLQPWGHHLTNVLLHIAAATALFLVLRRMTGALWASAFAAAFFAIHPLRAESVAWISERKDVLSGLFFMLTLGAYAFYAGKQSVARYLAVALFFVMGVLAKQMVITLPFLLLVLDYWPFKRFGEGRDGLKVFGKLVVEKLPLFVLSIASCVQVFVAGRPEPGQVIPGLNHTSWLRISNALVSYIVYIVKMFCPVDLSVFYPFPESVPAWQALGAFALLAGITAGVFVLRKKQPALLVGWLWYLGMMVPVIGFIPLGKEGHADRYTYLPSIGIGIMVAWGVAWLTEKWPFRREILAIAAALALSTLARLAVAQTGSWSDGVTLWQQALKHSPNDPNIHNFLGYALQMAGREDEAEAEYEKAITLRPDYAEPENNLGTVLMEKGDVTGAITHFNKALDYSPGHAEARTNLAMALIADKKLDEAIKQLRIVIQFRPDRPDAYNDLGNALVQKGDLDAAIAQFHTALDIKPDYADGHANLGNAYLTNGDPRSAVLEYQKALGINPQHVPVLLNLAHVLATCPDDPVRNGPKAVDYATQANELTGGKIPAVLDHLAAAYAEAGRFTDAIETERRAVEIADATGIKVQADLKSHLMFYRANIPLRAPVEPVPKY